MWRILLPRRPWAALALLASCGDPCRDLGEAICSCEKSAPERQECRRQRVVREGKYKRPKDRDEQARGRQRCAELIDSCTCEALAAGSLAACGLAPEPSAP